MAESLPRPFAQRQGCGKWNLLTEHSGPASAARAAAASSSIRPVTLGDLDRECGLCQAPLGAVTVFRAEGCARPVDGAQRGGSVSLYTGSRSVCE